jgi:hypothetical protein
VLIKLGMFCKTQSNTVHVHGGTNADGSSNDSKETVAWIAFALTPEDSARLKTEPHNSGHIDNCFGCEEEAMASPMYI